eukprot:CAMPEP_0117584192 /NCGR_PEP_ID=MMETSP0784-20121206/67454_1 /TAXON_ID=39447 /ORGANISM="" /LENGTH=70 /DNA_ID=CAMNT_0005385003 /DNA_START=5 /DNA_END=214 /DNA_ORIENTATION=+
MTTPQCAGEKVRIRSWTTSSTATCLRLPPWQRQCDASNTTNARGFVGRAMTAPEEMWAGTEQKATATRRL